MRLGLGLALVALLSGCMSLGINGALRPTANSSVNVGAVVDQTGRVTPQGTVAVDLF